MAIVVTINPKMKLCWLLNHSNMLDASLELKSIGHYLQIYSTMNLWKDFPCSEFFWFFFLLNRDGSTRLKVWPFKNVNRFCDIVLGFWSLRKAFYIYNITKPMVRRNSLYFIHESEDLLNVLTLCYSIYSFSVSIHSLTNKSNHNYNNNDNNLVWFLEVLIPKSPLLIYCRLQDSIQ